MIYFSDAEFICKCGVCGLGAEKVDKRSRARLELARAVAGIPFYLTSAVRCYTHNQAVGGAPNSSHIPQPYSTAFDVSFASKLHLLKILYGAISAGFNRIIVNTAKGYVHISDDDKKVPFFDWVGKWGEK